MQDFSCACKDLYLFNDKTCETFVDGKESKEYEEVLVNIINGFPLSAFYSSFHSLKRMTNNLYQIIIRQENNKFRNIGE